MKNKNIVLVFLVCLLLTSCRNNIVNNETNINNQNVEDIEIPDYLYFYTINSHDIYLDIYGNVFAKKGDMKVELVELSMGGYKYDLNELYDFIQYYKKYEDKEKNLYIYDEKFYTESLYKIDKNLNVEILSNKCKSPLIYNKELYFIDVDLCQVIKYVNNIKTVIMEEKGYKFDININKDNSLVIIKIKKDENYKWHYNYYIYNNDGITKIDNPKLKDEKITYKKIVNKKLINVEKIENYKENEATKNIETKNNENDNNKKTELMNNDYLYIDDDGRISYFLDGKKVKSTLVFLEGNVKANKGQICLADTYAYYFGPSGNAMSSGKINLYDNKRFQTDSNYRILKSCKNVYDILTKDKNKYELYNNYFLMGKYEQDNIIENDKEDIKWIVLEDNGNEVLLLSKYILDFRQYDINYLNNDFYNNAFSNSEKNIIINKNGENKIFYIDEETLKKHYEKHYKKMTNDTFLSAIPTYLTINKGIEIYKEDDIFYHHANYCIDNYKYVNSEGKIINIENKENKYGVRPAMWVKKN